jgi:hypothetical protein
MEDVVLFSSQKVNVLLYQDWWGERKNNTLEPCGKDKQRIGRSAVLRSLERKLSV